MNERDAMLREILENPAEDTARLVFADWLQENGEPERAEFIRLQINFGRADESYAYNTALREHRLLCLHAYDWTDPLMRGRSHKVDGATVRMPHDGALEYEASFRRGFIESLTSSTDEFLARAKAIFAAHPITSVRLIDKEPWEQPDATWRWWWHDGDPDRIVEDNELPDELYESGLWFTERDKAQRWLEQRCVTHARALAGLPPLA